MSAPTAEGSFKMSKLLDIPPILMSYEPVPLLPLVAGIVKDISSDVNPAVAIACTIMTPNTAMNTSLNMHIYNGCTTKMKFWNNTSDANLMQFIASSIALKLISTNTH
jgi:hypothetical protein